MGKPAMAPGNPKLLAALCMCAIVCGCGPEPASSRPRSGWYEGGPGAPGLEPGRNFYEAYPEKFPDFGFVTHTISAKRYSPQTEREGLEAALSLCREDFGQAFRNGRIEACMKDASPEQRLYAGEPYVRFEPEWVVIVVSNTGDAVPNNQLVSAYRMTKAGFIVSASDLLGDDVPIPKIADEAFRDPKPLEFDLSAERPRDETIYRIIERFQEHVEAQATPAESNGDED